MYYVIAYDFGTTGVKTCLFNVKNKIELVKSAYAPYGLNILDNGGAEQDADEWWHALSSTTKELMQNSGVTPDEIQGISFCSQMQGIVLVDREGHALRNPMSYMDQRAGEELDEVLGSGIKVSGANVFKLLKSLRLTKAASTSVKDPVWKYKWVKNHEPLVFAKVYKWLDVKEYLICRLTGEFVMTKDSAYSTFLYQTQGKWRWSRSLCRMYGVNLDHLPRIIDSTEEAGRLTETAARELGLKPGIPVYGGGGDANLIGVGAGATELGSTHIYSGTSGWVGTVTDKQLVDINSMIAAIVGSEPGRFVYFAEMETAGKCFEWVKDHLALDEIGIYLKKNHVAEDTESQYTSLYDYLSDVISQVPAGSGGVIFTPWLHGNRCPFEAPDAGGIFFNVRLETGKAMMIRAVQEGICYHLRWMLECQDIKLKTSEPIRFVGGGALSPVVCQMLADITGRTIETVANSQDVGAVGAAILVAVGSGKIKSINEASKLIQVKSKFNPNPALKGVYEQNYQIFKLLYKSNSKLFKNLNN